MTTARSGIVSGWSNPTYTHTHTHTSTYPIRQGVRACVVLGLAALAVQFLAALRLWCAKDVGVRRRFVVMCTLMAALDFVFTGLALLLWKVGTVWCGVERRN